MRIIELKDVLIISVGIFFVSLALFIPTIGFHPLMEINLTSFFESTINLLSNPTMLILLVAIVLIIFSYVTPRMQRPRG